MSGTNFGVDRVSPAGVAETVILSDGAGDVIVASGVTVPALAGAGYAKGCLFFDEDASVGSVMFVNEGSATSCNFNVFALGTAQTLLPNSAEGVAQTITPDTTKVAVGAVVNGVTDFITLPALSAVDAGHVITIICSAGGAFELRTPADSDEEINSENCDGTKEYLCTDTEIITVVKISDAIGWMATATSAIGTAVTAVVPD